MTHLHPTLAAAIGRDVLVAYRAGGPAVIAGQTRPDLVVGRAAGILGIVVDRDDVPTDLAIETDGSLAVIRIDRVLSLEVQS